MGMKIKNESLRMGIWELEYGNGIMGMRLYILRE